MSDKKPNCLPYTLAFRTPLKLRGYLNTCHKRLAGICRSFEAIENSHITLKFLGYSSSLLDDEKIIRLLPEIRALAQNYMPLRAYIRGFDTFEYQDAKSPVIFVKVLLNSQLEQLHNEICVKFATHFDFFEQADGKNFLPHITISKDMRPEKRRVLDRVIYRSKKNAKRRIKLNDLVIMTPTRLYSVIPGYESHLICPPVK